MIPDIPEKSIVMASPFVSDFSRGEVVIVDSLYKKKTGFFFRFFDHFVRFFTAQQISLIEDSMQPSTKPHIRRVVGMPGDTIYMRDYVLYVKEQGGKHFLTEFEISEKPYNVTFYVPPADWDTEIGVKGSFDEITLGPDEYFLLADNRKASDDSRLWGSVQKDRITARVLMCYFPFNKFKSF